jgi:hypothetical protein
VRLRRRGCRRRQSLLCFPHVPQTRLARESRQHTGSDPEGDNPMKQIAIGLAYLFGFYGFWLAILALAIILTR